MSCHVLRYRTGKCMHGFAGLRLYEVGVGGGQLVHVDFMSDPILSRLIISIRFVSRTA